MMLRLCLVCVGAFILFCWIDSIHGKNFHKRVREYRNKGRSEYHRKRSGNHAAGSAECLPDTPLVPNVLQPIKIDPYRMLGRWYSYIRYYKGIRTDVCNGTNVITTFNALVPNTLHPATGSSAVLFEQLFAYWDLDISQCALPEAYLGYLTPQGTESAIGYFGPEALSMDNSVVLSTDYNTYALHYSCSMYDMESGLCDYPFLYVFTRTRPDQLSTTTVDTIARVIKGLLSQYCVTPNMFVAEVWVPSFSNCPFVGPTDPCYLTLRQAHLDVAGGST